MQYEFNIVQKSEEQDNLQPLTSREKEQVEFLQVTDTIIAKAERELGKRVLDLVPNGKERFASMRNQFKQLNDEILSVTPKKQKVQIGHSMLQNEIRLCAKPVASSHQREALTVDFFTLKGIIDIAQEERCIGCILDNEECKKCELFNVLTCIVPLESYEGHYCPYYKIGWKGDDN